MSREPAPGPKFIFLEMPEAWLLKAKLPLPVGFPQHPGVGQSTLWTVGPNLLSTQHGKNLSPSSFQILGSGRLTYDLRGLVGGKLFQPRVVSGQAPKGEVVLSPLILIRGQCPQKASMVW